MDKVYRFLSAPLSTVYTPLNITPEKYCSPHRQKEQLGLVGESSYHSCIKHIRSLISDILHGIWVLPASIKQVSQEADLVFWQTDCFGGYLVSYWNTDQILLLNVHPHLFEKA